MTKTYNVAVLKGDGIGPEVTEANAITAKVKL
jgi:isocitrate/isopropylmalate dehydrogenase